MRDSDLIDGGTMSSLTALDVLVGSTTSNTASVATASKTSGAVNTNTIAGIQAASGVPVTPQAAVAVPVDEQTKIQSAKDAIAAATKAGIPTSVGDTVTSSRSGITAKVGTGLATILSAQNAQDEADAKLKESTKPKDLNSPPAGTYYQWHPFVGGGGEWRLLKSGSFGGSTTNTNNNGADITGYNTVGGILQFNGTPFSGLYNGQTYVNGIVKTGSTTDTTGGNYGGSGTTGDPFTQDGKVFTGTIFGSTYKNGVIVDVAAQTAADIAKQARLAANVEFANTMKGLGLPQSLVDELDSLIKNDYTKSQMYLELIKTPAYKERFPGMDALRAAGKAVDEGTYINMEKGFLQTLQYYGIDKNIFGTTAELGKYISGLTSPKEFEDRVALASQDVEKNPDVLAELNLYYGVDKSAAITYLLNPTVGLDLIKRQARAAEIGAQAAKSKFDFGQTQAGYGVAESFINAAGTMDLASLDVTFQQARQLAGSQGKIAAIEGQQYNDLDAVSAILGKDQATILDSQRRAAREAARFGGGSGVGSASLKTETLI